MKRTMISVIGALTLAASATAANAQVFYDDGYYAPRGPYVERSVGLHAGPVGIGIYAEPQYRYGYTRDRYWSGDSPQSTYNTRAFRSQEWTPQSPPSGGY